MPRARLASLALGLTLFIMCRASPVIADFFYYRDAQGQLHLTNVRSRIPSAYLSQADCSRRPNGTPSLATEQQTVAPKAENVIRVQPTMDPDRVGRLQASNPQVSPVNLHEFGLLHTRMSKFEVFRRLGPPAVINDIGKLSPHLWRAGHTLRLVKTQTWYYPGTSRTPATRLEFFDGLLRNKVRELR